VLMEELRGQHIEHRIALGINHAVDLGLVGPTEEVIVVISSMLLPPEAEAGLLMGLYKVSRLLDAVQNLRFSSPTVV